MSGHVHDGCDRPRWFLRRFRHRPWVCDCGKAYRTEYAVTYGGGGWIWAEWNPCGRLHPENES